MAEIGEDQRMSAPGPMDGAIERILIPPVPVHEAAEGILEGMRSWVSESFKEVNDSIQYLYASFQAAKVDVSGFTFAYDVVKFDEGGLKIAGIEVWSPPYIRAAEEILEQRRREGDGGESVSRAEFEALRSRLDGTGRTARGGPDAQGAALASAADLNREIFGYRQESERSLGRIRAVHVEAKAFREDIEHRTKTAADEFVRIVRTIDQALAG